MKTKPITIEPGSGTKLAGKKITLASDQCVDLPETIIFVSNILILLKDSNGAEWTTGLHKNWLEVLPDDPPVHDEFFKLNRDRTLLNKGTISKGPNTWEVQTVTINDLAEAIESRILAKLKSEGVVK